ncbi:MAG: tail fiber protein [Actinomycetota bacterium]|nr:tail fiber protein [Actinomycetota bacterium]
MADPFIGEIRMFAGSFSPNGWMFCNGAILPISEYDTLFTLIGTTYGGDGQETFALPNLQSRLPLHRNASHLLGEASGTETVTLTTSQMPLHAHALTASSGNATASGANGNVLAQTPTYTPYIAAGANKALSPVSVGPEGGSQPHENVQPFLCINFIISLFGIYPSQT